MEPAKKELIEKISEIFKDYEEAYVPGEWESFSQSKRKKTYVFPQWIKVAAVFFMVLSALVFYIHDISPENGTSDNVVTTVKIPPAEKDMAGENGIQNPFSGKGANEERGEQTADSKLPNPMVTIKNNQVGPLKSRNTDYRPEIQNNSPSAIQGNNPLKAQTNSLPALEARQYAWSATHIPLARPLGKFDEQVAHLHLNEERKRIVPVYESQPGHVVSTDSVAAELQKVHTLDFLLSESKIAKAARPLKKKEIKDKWNFGVEVMPAMMKSNLNIGAGITTAYSISKSFSISSGISVLQMEGGQMFPAAANNQSSVSTLSSKRLVAVNADISAIDIPIALVFNVSKNLYTSAGVSYFNVIGEKRNNTYEQTSQFSMTVFNPETGLNTAFRTLKTEAVAEPVPESPLKGNSYLGFFNFSIGRQQNIFNKYKVNIEPFIKIPVGKLSAEEMDLMNSGIKFRLSF